jgi:hypothetical protein
MTGAAAALSQPWSAASLPPMYTPELTGLPALPGYAAAQTHATPATLTTPWAGQAVPLPAPAAVSSFAEIMHGL